MSRLALSFLVSAFTLAAQPVDYARQIHPVFVARCFACHQGAQPQAKLSMATRDALLAGGVSGPALVPGDAQASLLAARLKGERGARMPLAGAPLSPGEIKLIETWINEGAKITGVTPSGPAPAYSLKLEAPANTDIDQILKIKPNPVADHLYARRAYLDLWGLLPSPAEQQAFARDQRKDKRLHLINQLLENQRHYSEHWITFWNDLLHNDEGVTYIGDRQTITPWLLKSLRENKPYDQFVQALLNPQSKDDPEGFLKGVNWRGTVNASQTPVMQAAQNSAQVFLGVNLKCNSCHDSFISHWKLKEAYALASFFSDQPLEIARCDNGTGQMAKPGFLFPELGTVNENATLAEKRAAAARLFTTKENGLFARTIVNRVWKKLFGRAIIEPIDEMEGPAFSPALLDWLAQDFVNHGYDMKHLLRTIMASNAYQLPTVSTGNARDVKAPFNGPWPRRLTAEQFADSLAAITGEWKVRIDNRPVPGTYAREWRFKPNALTRALGRPMRDGAVTERQTEASTLQALELANGETLNTTLTEGARRLLDQAQAAPANLFDSGLLRQNSRVKVDLDITGRKQLRLLVINVDSYDPSRVIAAWMNAELLTADGRAVKLSSLPTASNPTKRTITPPKEKTAFEALTAALPYELVYDIAGQNFTRFRAELAVDQSSADSEVNPAYRAFVFDEKPNQRHLVATEGEPPLPPPPTAKTPEALVRQLYLHALGRAPQATELKTALGLLGQTAPQRQGLEDLLWTIALSPEFQFIL